jgi:hypothetical protein
MLDTFETNLNVRVKHICWLARASRLFWDFLRGARLLVRPTQDGNAMICEVTALLLQVSGDNPCGELTIAKPDVKVKAPEVESAVEFPGNVAFSSPILCNCNPRTNL